MFPSGNFSCRNSCNYGGGGGGPNNDRAFLEVLRNIDRNLSTLCRLLENGAAPAETDAAKPAPT